MNSSLALPIRLAHAFESELKVKGRMQAHVVSATGKVIKTLPWQDNLILDQGMDYYGSNTWANLMNFCVAGTGTTPTRDILDGTAAQSGTTVTLSGSSYVLTSGDIGKWFGWADGSQAKITAIISDTQATVAQSQTVSAATATLYRCNQTGLANEVTRTNTYPTFTYTDGRGASASWGTAGPPSIITLRRTYDFSAEVGSVNYTEIGISPVNNGSSPHQNPNNLFARILLAGTVTVTAGQQLRITYELAITVSNTDRPLQTLTSSAGWPYTYNIASIASTSSDFTVTLSAPHHYVAGGKINIAAAKRPRFTITAATSTGSDFTITTSGSHGRSSGDSVVIEGMSPSGYNGTWTCAAGTSGSTIVVTTAANPGTGTVFGNVRQAEPGTWYNGEWTIASVTSTTVVVTSTINAGAAGADGTVKNDLKAKMYMMQWPIAPLGGSAGAYGVPVSPDSINHWLGAGGSWSTYFGGNTNTPGSGSGGDGMLDGTLELGVSWVQNVQLYGKATAPSTPSSTFPQTSAHVMSGGTAYSSSSNTLQSYTAGNFYRDIICEWNTGAGNATDIRAICFTGFGNNNSSSGANLLWIFEEPQRKDSTNRLRITFRRSWRRTFA
jgi:hypothetical protein